MTSGLPMWVKPWIRKLRIFRSHNNSTALQLPPFSLFNHYRNKIGNQSKFVKWFKDTLLIHCSPFRTFSDMTTHCRAYRSVWTLHLWATYLHIPVHQITLLWQRKLRTFCIKLTMVKQTCLGRVGSKVPAHREHIVVIFHRKWLALG